MASSISQGLVLTTAMVFSTTVLYLALSWQNPFQTPDSPLSNKQILRSCLCTEEKKKERKRKKRVKFAKNVMVMVIVKEEEEEEEEEETDIIEEIGEEQQNRGSSSISNCRNEIPANRGMPANRIALYNGILRDRGNRMGCCH